MKALLVEQLNSAKGQLEYCNSALESQLENWERREFESVKGTLLSEIDSLKNRIEIA